MKSYVFHTFNLIIIALFQSSFFSELFGTSITPNLVAAYVFSLFLLFKRERVLYSAFAGGLIIDLFGTANVGISSIIMIIVLLIIYTLGNLSILNNFIKFLILFVGIFVVNISYVLVTSASLSSTVLLSSLLSCVFLTLFYFAFIWIGNLAGYTFKVRHE